MEIEIGGMVDAFPGLIWTARPDGYVEFFNRGWYEYTGLGADEARGQSWQAAIHPEDLAKLLEHWQAILASRVAHEAEARLRRFDGQYRLFLFRAWPSAGGPGQTLKWHGMFADIEDRTRSQDALHSRWWLWPPARDNHFKFIIDSIQAMAVHVTPAGAVEHVNRSALEYFGTTLEEIKTWEVMNLVHPDDILDLTVAWWGGIDSGQTYDINIRLRRVDGVYRWFHVRGFLLKDVDEKIVLCYLLLRDIDEWKRAEELLAGEKRLLELVTSGHPMPTILEALCQFVESTARGCYCSVVLVDASGTRIEHGASPSLPPSFLASILGSPVNVDSGPCAMAACLNQQVIAGDLEAETRWAEHAWCQMAMAHGLRACWSTPIASTAGKILGAFAIYYNEPRTPSAQDQSLIGQFTAIASIAIGRAQNDAALKQSEENLRRSGAYLAEAQKLSLTGSFGWSVSIDEHFWSEETFRIFEYDVSTPVTMQMVLDRALPQDIPLIRQAIELAADGLHFDYECRFLMPGGALKYLHIVGHRIRGRDGQLEYIGAVQDVTQHRRSEEALGKMRSELSHVARVTTLGALTASIAHEVNQPLSGIITNASTCLRMLAADPPNIDGALETARRTIRDGNRASDVITRLRALFTRKGVKVEAVDLNEAAREVIALSRSELQRGRVILKTAFADDLPMVRGDRVQLQQVVLNLFMNASEAMSEVNDRPRELGIRTEQIEDDQVRLAVCDAGTGFESQAADKIFEAFYTTKSAGMGIGLSVSRSIIESHNGRLWATPNEGPGVTFSFSIPCGIDGLVVPHASVSPVIAASSMKNP